MGTRETPPAAAGFLYVEALVAVAMLAFALVGLAPMFILAARENAASGDLTYAATLATDKAESVKGMDFAALAAGTTEEVFKLRAMSFWRTTVVADNAPHPGMKTVTVTVTPRRRVNFGEKRVATVRFYRVR
jgi:Tfp pilus assembly protein PilV